MTIENEKKLIKIFEKKFNLKNKKNKIQKLSASNFKKWDSLEHLKIIMEIERNFKKKFTFTEIINLKSFKKICETLKKK